MRKLLFFFAAIAFLFSTGKAQYNTVEKIRAYYTKVSTNISTSIKTKQGEYCNEINVNTTNASWPAVGSYKKKISIWYSDDPVSHGEDKPEQFLDKVITTSESAGSKYTEEYLFADGELVFCLYVDFYNYNGAVQKDEHRLYVSKGKILKYDSKLGGHNEYARTQADVQTEAVRSAKMMKQLFLNSCEYKADETQQSN